MFYSSVVVSLKARACGGWRKMVPVTVNTVLQYVVSVCVALVTPNTSLFHLISINRSVSIYCSSSIGDGYGPSWQICSKLGTANELQQQDAMSAFP